MSTLPAHTGTYLRPGQFYGEVIRKHECSGLVLSELRHVTGRKLPPHSHKLAYFCLLLQGDYAEYLGRRTLQYSPATMMFHPSGLTHRDEIGERGGHFLSIEMESHWLERLREYSIVPDTVVRVEEGSAALAVRLYREFQAFDSCAPLAIEGIVMTMLADLARARVKDERRKPDWLSRAVDLLHDEFCEQLNITRVASEVGVHPFHLSRVFRQFHQETIGEYVNKLRVQYACSELSNLETELADVALGAGFADQSHFTRIFKRVTGMTPGAYRKTLKRPY